MQSATLQDLSPEEKAKIGALIQKLSLVVSQKKAVETDLLSQIHTLHHKVATLERQNAQLAKSKRKLTEKLANCEEKANFVSSKLAEKLANAPLKTTTAVQTQENNRKTQNCGTQTEEPVQDHTTQRTFQAIRQEITQLSATLQTLADNTAGSLVTARKSLKSSDRVESCEQREDRLRTVLARSVANSQRGYLLREASKDTIIEKKPQRAGGKYREKSSEFTEEMEWNGQFTGPFSSVEALLSPNTQTPYKQTRFG